MNKFIELAQERLRSKLSDKQAFYELDDLKAAGVPGIVIEPLRRELIHQLHRDLEMPLTEWANLNHDSVEEAWNAFMEEAERHIRLPEYKVNALLKSVVNRLYPLLVWPRAQIPKFIFGKKEEMERSEIARRVEKLPVNQQLGSAVMRYMNKKNVDRLTRQKCKDIVQKIDEKLTERYNDQKWYRSIEPLFELSAGPVPTDLLASYFFHRGQNGWSNRLAQMAGEISASDFEEWIKEEAPENESHSQIEEATSEAANRASQSDSTVQPTSSRHTQVAAEAERASSDSDEESNINAQFTAAAADQESSETTGASTDDESGDIGRQRQEQDQSRMDRQEEQTRPEEASGEDEPIWRRFLGGSGSDSEKREKEQAKSERSNSRSVSSSAKSGNGYQLNELFKEDNGELDNEKARQLNRFLEGQREYFIREIFRGSLSAYEQAVRTLSDCEDWEEAYPYIDRQIFDRNDIDLYSQPALDFTDTLQSFFENH